RTPTARARRRFKNPDFSHADLKGANSLGVLELSRREKFVARPGNEFSSRKPLAQLDLSGFIARDADTERILEPAMNPPSNKELRRQNRGFVSGRLERPALARPEKNRLLTAPRRCS